MSDGAHSGVGAERALRTVLGGDPQPTENERETREAVRQRITAAADRTDPASYGDCADIVAGLVLRFYETHPEARDWPAEQQGRFENSDGAPCSAMDPGARYVPPTGPDLYSEVKKFAGGNRIADLGITGFQWGWAVNAARYVSELPPEPNPAILTVGG